MCQGEGHLGGGSESEGVRRFPHRLGALPVIAMLALAADWSTVRALTPLIPFLHNPMFSFVFIQQLESVC